MGSTVDRSDRFTLVFTQVETDGIFAYQSGNDIIVSGDGELQVFDVMGRLVMTQHINGVQSLHFQIEWKDTENCYQINTQPVISTEVEKSSFSDDM